MLTSTSFHKCIHKIKGKIKTFKYPEKNWHLEVCHNLQMQEQKINQVFSF